MVATVVQFQAVVRNTRSSLDLPSSPGASLRTAVIARRVAGSAVEFSQWFCD